MNNRSETLAVRLEAGASALAAFAATLSEPEWQTRLPKNGRKLGVMVHHVAAMYPLEIPLANLLAGGQPITGVAWDAVHKMNRDHATENDGVTKEAALALLATNSAAAAAAIRALGDEQLDRAAAVSLNSDAPAHLPVLPGRSRGAPQLPPPRRDQGGPCRRNPEQNCGLVEYVATANTNRARARRAGVMRTVVSLLAGFTFAHALPAGETLTLRQAVSLALQSNLLVTAADAGERRLRLAFARPVPATCRGCSSPRAFSAATTLSSCSARSSLSASSVKETSPSTL
jgi:hypothetical protein